jgi:hypothetical protein
MSVLLRDSIFVFNKIGIEKVMRFDDLIINDELSRTYSLETYYRIDFDKRRFQNLGKELINKKEEDFPFTSTKYGINFKYKYYNGEKYTESDTSINNRPCKVFRYVGNSDSPLKGAFITLVFSDMKSKIIHLIPNLEDTFNGRLLTMEATDDKDAKIVLVLEHIPKLSDNWKKVLSR